MATGRQKDLKGFVRNVLQAILFVILSSWAEIFCNTEVILV